jgi:hypothetical protein
MTGLAIVGRIYLQGSCSRHQVTKAWAKREAQVNAMVDSIVGVVGDLQRIYGDAEISAIDDPPTIEGKAA